MNSSQLIVCILVLCSSGSECFKFIDKIKNFIHPTTTVSPTTELPPVPWHEANVGSSESSDSSEETNLAPDSNSFQSNTEQSSRRKSPGGINRNTTERTKLSDHSQDDHNDRIIPTTNRYVSFDKVYSETDIRTPAITSIQDDNHDTLYEGNIAKTTPAYPIYNTQSDNSNPETSHVLTPTKTVPSYSNSDTLINDNWMVPTGLRERHPTISTSESDINQHQSGILDSELSATTFKTYQTESSTARWVMNSYPTVPPQKGIGEDPSVKQTTSQTFSIDSPTTDSLLDVKNVEEGFPGVSTTTTSYPNSPRNDDASVNAGTSQTTVRPIHSHQPPGQDHLSSSDAGNKLDANQLEYSKPPSTTEYYGRIVFPDDPSLNPTPEAARIFTKGDMELSLSTTARTKAAHVPVDGGRTVIVAPTKTCGTGRQLDDNGKCRKIARK